MNADKLAKLQAQVRIGGKGTPRRKVKRTNGSSMGGDDKKLAGIIKQLNVHPLSNVQEVNMFGEGGKVLHFASPRVFATEQPNTFVVNGPSTTKEITELVPGILSQLGPDSLASLRKLAETYQSMNPDQIDGDDEIPDLVENFDAAEISEKAEE